MNNCWADHPSVAVREVQSTLTPDPANVTIFHFGNLSDLIFVLHILKFCDVTWIEGQEVIDKIMHLSKDVSILISQNYESVKLPGWGVRLQVEFSQLLTWALRRNAARAPCLVPSDHFGVQTPRTNVWEQTCAVVSNKLVVICHSSNRKLIQLTSQCKQTS